MLEHKKYSSIEIKKDINIDNFKSGVHILVQEKLDGANASLQYNENLDIIQSFSRNQTLNEENNLRGFFEYSNELDKQKFKEVFSSNLRVFGEWLIPHTVVYSKDCYNKFYVFDIYDYNNNTYLNHVEVEEFAKSFGFDVVPNLFEGTFENWEQLEEFVGVTKMGGEIGEGIIVRLSRIHNNIDDLILKAPKLLKIVHSNFKETQISNRTRKNRKPKAKVELPEDYEQAESDTESIVTKNRIKKLLDKMVDENELSENWNKDNISEILKVLPKKILEDCRAEEPEIVEKIDAIYPFKKLCHKRTILVLKEFY